MHALAQRFASLCPLVAAQVQAAHLPSTTLAPSPPLSNHHRPCPMQHRVADPLGRGHGQHLHRGDSQAAASPQQGLYLFSPTGLGSHRRRQRGRSPFRPAC